MHAQEHVGMGSRKYWRMGLWCFCILVFFVPFAHASAAQYESPDGAFAFIPPAGWDIKKEADEPFPALSGPRDDDRAPYVVINVTKGDDIFVLGDATVKEMLKEQRYQLNLRDSFQTADDKFGVKYVLAVKAPAPYRQVYYFVEGPPGKIYAFLVTVPESGWTAYQPLLDAMMRTFHLRPVAATPAKNTANPAVAPAAATTPASTDSTPANTVNSTPPKTFHR